MIYTLDLERDAKSSLIRQQGSTSLALVRPSFWADQINLKLILSNPKSWVGDSSTIIKARIGILPSTYLVEPVTGSWDGEAYNFVLDFNNNSFDTAITDKLELDGFFEIQVEYNGKSRTILQQSALFRNSFLGATQVTLTLPDEPSLIGSEVISPPIAPSVPVASSSPRKPSRVKFDRIPEKPIEVGAGNLSITPNKPSLPEVEELFFPPAKPSKFSSKLYGLPDAPSQPAVNEVTPKPLKPLFPSATLVVQPVLNEVNAYEVQPHNFHSDHHKYLYFQTSGKLTNRLTGSIMQAESKPFVFSGVDQFGAPTYLRESPVEIIDPETGLATNYEHIKVKRRTDSYHFGLQNPLTLKTIEAVSWYNPEGYNITRVNLGSNHVTYYSPKNQPANLSSLDARLYEVKILLAYQYDSDTSTQPRPNTLELTTYTQEVYPDPEQLNKLGYKHYGGRKLSYLNTTIGSIKNASNSTREEFAEAGHSISFKPAYSGLVALPPAIISNPEAVKVTEIQNNPSLVSAVVKDFLPTRYSPSVWLDASQEDMSIGQELDNLTNFAGTSYEIHKHAEPAVMGNKYFDFSSTRNAYAIPQNVFGTHFEEGGNEVEIYIAYKPLDYDPYADEKNTLKRGYNPHLFVNRGGDQRFTCHAPHTNGTTFYFDAGRNIPTLQARVSGNFANTLNKNTILGLRSSAGAGLSTIFVNGVNTGEKSSVAEKVFMTSLLLGGWGASSYGQSMHLYEVLLFRNKLEDTQREKIEGYLAHKWGIAGDLASNHPYKNTSPDNLGEFRELDPFPKKPLIFVDAYPVAPSTPLSGFASARPSEVTAGAVPNAPSLPVADDIPLLRFMENGTNELSALNTTGLTTDLPEIEKELKATLESIQIFNINNALEPVTFSVTNNNTGEISPAVTSVEDGKLSTFVLNAVENKPYLEENEQGELSFSISVQDNQNNTNFLPVKIAVKGVNRQFSVVSELSNFSQGLVLKTDETPAPIDEGNNGIFALGYPDVSRTATKILQIPHKTTPYSFNIRVITPDKSGAKLFCSMFAKHFRGRTYQLNGKPESRGEKTEELTAGSEFYPVIEEYGQTFEYRRRLVVLSNGYTYYTGNPLPYFKGWVLENSNLGNLPVKVRCTNVTVVTPDVEKIYTCEIEILTAGVVHNALGEYDQSNLLHRFSYQDYFKDEGRGSFRGFLPEEIAEDFTKGFRARFHTGTGQDLLKVYPMSYGLPQPKNVQASVGARPWQNPVEVKAEPKLAKFPVDLNIEPICNAVLLTGSSRINVSGSNDKYHWLDPLNKVIPWSSAGAITQTNPTLKTSSLNTSWVWGINFESFNKRLAPTFIHYTELNNIKVDDIPEDVIQQPWRYPFTWDLIDTGGNKTTGVGRLDPVTLGKLNIKKEKLITFPSGKQIRTEFGGYVCTSGKVNIKIHPLGRTSNGLTHYLDQVTNSYTCELNNLGNIKPRTNAYYGDGSRYFRELASITTAVKVNRTYTGTTLALSEYRHLNYIYEMMQGKTPLDNYNGMVSQDRINPEPATFSQEFKNYRASEFFLHTEKQEDYENIYNYHGEQYPNTLNNSLPLFGNSSTKAVPYRFSISIKVEPSDRIDASVHPKWGRAYTKIYDIEPSSFSNPSIKTRVQVPELPSHLELQPTAPDKEITFKEWQFIQDNKPNAPVVRKPYKEVTWKDLVLHKTMFHVLNEDFNPRGYYFIIRYDGTEIFYTPAYKYISHNLSQVYVPAKYEEYEVRAGDVYKCTSFSTLELNQNGYVHGYLQLTKIQRADGTDSGGAKYITINKTNYTKDYLYNIYRQSTSEANPYLLSDGFAVVDSIPEPIYHYHERYSYNGQDQGYWHTYYPRDNDPRWQGAYDYAEIGGRPQEAVQYEGKLLSKKYVKVTENCPIVTSESQGKVKAGDLIKINGWSWEDTSFTQTGNAYVTNQAVLTLNWAKYGKNRELLAWGSHRMPAYRIFQHFEKEIYARVYAKPAEPSLVTPVTTPVEPSEIESEILP